MFNVPSTLKITKEFLLSKYSEETYMSTYLGAPVKSGLQISGLRDDRTPTACFYRNKAGELKYHDFGIGFDGNFINVVMFKFKLTFREALDKIGRDFGFLDSDVPVEPIKIRTSDVKIEEKADTIIQIESQPFTPQDLNWWKSYGVSESTLKFFKVFSCKNVFLHGHYYTSSSDRRHIFGYYGGKKGGIELWRIYFPGMKTYKFLSNWGKTLIQGAKQLPPSGDLLVVTKSLKDVMVLYEFGINAIAPCSENLFLTDAQLQRLQTKFKKIVVFYDNDLPGIAGMNKIKKKHPELSFCFIPRKYEAKDLSDYYKKYGKNKTKALIDKAKSSLSIGQKK